MMNLEELVMQEYTKCKISQLKTTISIRVEVNKS